MEKSNIFLLWNPLQTLKHLVLIYLIAEHKMKILVTPGKKIQVLSSSARKTHFRNQTPKKPTSYSVLSQQYRQKCADEDNESEESIQTIRNRIQNSEDLSVRDIERYERIVRKVVNQNQMKKEAFSRTPVVMCT